MKVLFVNPVRREHNHKLLVYAQVGAAFELDGRHRPRRLHNSPRGPSGKKHAVGPGRSARSDVYYGLRTRKEQSSKNNLLAQREEIQGEHHFSKPTSQSSRSCAVDLAVSRSPETQACSAGPDAAVRSCPGSDSAGCTAAGLTWQNIGVPP